MTNKEIARLFNQLAGLMELHGDNPYKIRSFNFVLCKHQLQLPIPNPPTAFTASGKAITGA